MKKVIAKEVLLFLIIIILTSIALLASKLHYSHFEKQREDNLIELRNIRHELNSLEKEISLWYDIRWSANKLAEKHLTDYQEIEYRPNDEEYYVELRELIRFEMHSEEQFLHEIREAMGEPKIQVDRAYGNQIEGLYGVYDLDIIQESTFDTLKINNSLEKTDKLKKEQKKISNKISIAIRKKDNSDNYLRIAFLLAIFAYPIRLLYFIIRWAIRTVKEE